VSELFAAQEIWEAFLVDGKKSGFLRRQIRRAAGDLVEIDLSVAFVSDDELIRFRHGFAFRDAPGFPWTSYRLERPDRAVTAIRFDGAQVSGEVAGSSIEMPVPPGTVPSYGFYPHVLSMPFEEGYRRRLPALEDASCTLLPEVDLVSVGWETIRLLDVREHLWRIDELGDEEGANTYWLDADRRLRKADWEGIESIRVPGREQALAGLRPEIAALAGP